MIESPLIQELMAKRMHKAILTALAAHFEEVPEEIALALRAVQDDDRLNELVAWAVRCPDIEAFQTRLNDMIASSNGTEAETS
jgi:hypothetical protein